MDSLFLKYFILKPRGTDIYASASRKAMKTYARHIYEKNKKFSQDIFNWAEKEETDCARNAKKASLFTRRQIENAVNASCTCGGRGIGENECPACEVYHRLKIK